MRPVAQTRPLSLDHMWLDARMTAASRRPQAIYFLTVEYEEPA